jgi:hypothetical protein
MVSAASGLIALLGLGTTCLPSSASDATSVLQVFMTDAPFPQDSVLSVDMWVLRVEARVADIDSLGAANVPAAGTNTDPFLGFVTIAEPNNSFSLTTYTAGATVQLGGADVQLSVLQGFRMFIDTDRSTITLRDGTVLRAGTTPGIIWPGTGVIGVKVTLDHPVDLEVEDQTVVVDFDLGKSFLLNGPSISAGGLTFRPSLRGVAPDSTGSVSGTVRQDNAAGALVSNAIVEVLVSGSAVDESDPSKVVGSGKTDATGAFKLAFLPPGTYALRASPPSTLSPYDPVLLSLIVIAAGTDASGNLLVLPHQ